MDTLRSNVHVVASPSVWMETNGLEQLASVAATQGCRRAVGMPDLHAGRGLPIGAAFLFDDVVVPDLVGGDVGCGVLLLVGRRDGPRGDALERRVRAALDEADRGLAKDALAAILSRGPRALLTHAELTDGEAELLMKWAEEDEVLQDDSEIAVEAEAATWQLGTIGGGNHFAEVSRVERVFDRSVASALGIHADAQAVLVHTGSRAVGAAFHDRHRGVRLEGADAAAYLASMRCVVRYARANRWLVAFRLLRAAGLGSAERVSAVVDLVHNDVSRFDGGFLHRKGVAPAERDAPTVVLGSRGAPSFVMLGRGETCGLCSVAHGAGRRMSRGDAYAKLRDRHRRASLARTELAGRVICDDPRLMYEEHPDAYKPIEPVIESLEAFGLASRVASLVPLVTVKR